ncbi:MAG: large conductance mechanosensitive channel protein MscL [Dehalococcoidia bacterium]
MNQGIIKEFRDFITKGNVIELAVAVIMAGAFAPVITSLVEGVFTPFLAAIFGEPNFDNVGFDVGDSRVRIGLVITAGVNFVMIAAGVFFFVIKPLKMLEERRKAGAEPPPPTPEDIQLLREIRDELRRR